VSDTGRAQSRVRYQLERGPGDSGQLDCQLAVQRTLGGQRNRLQTQRNRLQAEGYRTATEPIHS
jgi:hypothetical protein